MVSASLTVSYRVYRVEAATCLQWSENTGPKVTSISKFYSSDNLLTTVVQHGQGEGERDVETDLVLAASCSPFSIIMDKFFPKREGVSRSFTCRNYIVIT